MLRQLFARSDHVAVGPHVIGLRPLGPLCFQQTVHAVKRDAPVVADDAAAPIGIGKAGDDARLPALHDLRRVGVEHPVIVGLAIFRKCLANLRVRLEPRRFQASFDHAQSAERKNRALERLVGLQADDHLVIAIDISGLMREQRRGCLRIDGEHAFFLFLLEIGLQLLPDRLCAFGRADKKGLIACIRRNIADDEIAHRDRVTPGALPEPSPITIIV